MAKLGFWGIRGIAFAAALVAAPAAFGQSAGLSGGAGDMPEFCRVPRAVFVDESRLPLIAKKVQERKRLTIVALGSSSTQGMGASGPDAAWPARFEADLKRRLPDLRVDVHNRAKARESADQMLKRLRGDVLALRPDLVIWETGTADAVRAVEIDHFAGHLDDGIAQIAATGAETVMVTPQYARDTARLIAFQPYIDAMNQVGLRRDVLVFPRYEAMRFWTESGAMKFENVPRAEMTKVADALYDCLGRQIARIVVRAMDLPPGAVPPPPRGRALCSASLRGATRAPNLRIVPERFGMPIRRAAMRNVHRLASFAVIARAFRHSAFALGVVVAIAVAGQTAAVLLRPTPAPAAAGKAPGLRVEPGLRQPAHSGLRAPSRAVDAGFAVDAYDLRMALEPAP
ncbi:MAG: SGNH/GDSL hydrolase family protein [Tagaea sp.]